MPNELFAKGKPLQIYLGQDDAGGAYASIKRPVQSWEVQGSARMEVCTTQPILVASRLRGVARVDTVKRFSLAAAMTHGGLGCIPLERLVHEIAYKVARAPKFGS